MRRIRELIAAIIVWMAAVAVGAVVFYSYKKPGTDYTTSNSYVKIEDELFVSDNFGDNGSQG